MKKKILSGLFASALLIVAAIGAMESKKSEAGLSDLALANVEALANWESNIDDLINNCYWKAASYCNYIVIMPDGYTIWEHWNMDNYY